MFGRGRDLTLSPEEAGSLKFQFELLYGPNWKDEVKEAWEKQSWFLRLWYRITGETYERFVSEYDRAYAEFVAQYEDGYCGPGCVCYNPDGTPKGEDKAWDKAHETVQAAYSNIEEIQKAQVL